jgi:arginine N-succinyltransferase
MPHPNGRAAMRMLETEGFTNPGYVDIFDGGPTMVGQINSLRTVSGASDVTLAAVHEQDGEKMLVATGRLADYRCTYGFVTRDEEGAVSLDKLSTDLLGIEPGQDFTMVERA